MFFEDPPKVGDAVTHDGRSARITKVNPDGTYELQYDEGMVTTASPKDVSRVPRRMSDA